MKSQRLVATFVFFAVLLWSLFQMVFYYDKLPNEMAIHFNFEGKADGYALKSTFFLLYGIMFFFLSGVFGMFSFMISKLTELSRIPNKEFWLSGQNRKRTEDVLTIGMLLIGTITLAFLSLVFQKMALFNLEKTNSLGSMAYWFVGLIAALAPVVIFLARAFGNKAVMRRKRKTGQQNGS